MKQTASVGIKALSSNSSLNGTPWWLHRVGRMPKFRLFWNELRQLRGPSTKPDRMFFDAKTLRSVSICWSANVSITRVAQCQSALSIKASCKNAIRKRSPTGWLLIDNIRRYGSSCLCALRCSINFNFSYKKRRSGHWDAQLINEERGNKLFVTNNNTKTKTRQLWRFSADMFVKWETWRLEIPPAIDRSVSIVANCLIIRRSIISSICFSRVLKLLICNVALRLFKYTIYGRKCVDTWSSCKSEAFYNSKEKTWIWNIREWCSGVHKLLATWCILFM